MVKKIARRPRRRSDLLLRKLEDRILVDASMDVGIPLDEAVQPIQPIAEDSQTVSSSASGPTRFSRGGHGLEVSSLRLYDGP